MTTSTEIARSTGIPRRTIQWRCARLGIVRQGRDYHLTEEQAREVVNYRGRYDDSK